MPNSDRDKRRVAIFDTTLRDGEQAPGAALTIAQKIEIAELLDRQLGVAVIEAGFPISSNGAFEAVKTIADRTRHAVVAGLARANPADIDRAAEALKGAVHPRIHTFIATSRIHMEQKLQMSEMQVLAVINASVTRARNLTAEVQWSAEDATRTDYDFLVRAIETAIKAGATIINIPDTVGYAVPWKYGPLIAKLVQRFGVEYDGITFSTHCHDDLGMAVANSLAGVKNGARQVECTINGIGERAGNAALEEVVMALAVRSDEFGLRTGIDGKILTRASKLVSGATGFPVQYNKAIVGKNAFAHESGIHQDGMLKSRDTYEIMLPEDVGAAGTTLSLGKLSGKNAFRQELRRLGYEVGDNQLPVLMAKFKILADAKKHITEDDLRAIVDDNASREEDHIRVACFSYTGGMSMKSSADITLTVHNEMVVGHGNGDGPVDAMVQAFCMAHPHKGTLDWEFDPVTPGSDAQASVSVWLTVDGKKYRGRGVDTDTVNAAARALANVVSASERPDAVHSTAP